MAPKLPEILELPLPEKKPSNITDVVGQGHSPFNNHLAQIENRQKSMHDAELIGLRKQRIDKIQKTRNSKVIVYYGLDLLDFKDAEEIYEVLACYPSPCNLDLFLLSSGGYSGAAFKIARMFQEMTSGDGVKFSVLIPYYAKSAATILALGADEIVMGLSSEMGPIDPQLPTSNGHVPLLALKDAIDYVKNEVASNPATAQLFWPLIQQIQLMSLGQFEREISSAKQYAEQLLRSRMFKNVPEQSAITAERLTSWYKNHGHIIDRTEARETLNLNIVDADAELWNLMWQLHKLYDLQARKSASPKGIDVKYIETFETLKIRKMNPNKSPVNMDGDINGRRKN